MIGDGLKVGVILLGIAVAVGITVGVTLTLLASRLFALL